MTTKSTSNSDVTASSFAKVVRPIPTTPPNRRRRVAPHPHQHRSLTPPAVENSFESYVHKKNQQNRILQQYYEHTSIVQNRTNAVAPASGKLEALPGTNVDRQAPPPSRTRDWRLQRFQRDIQEQISSRNVDSIGHNDVPNRLRSISEEDSEVSSNKKSVAAVEKKYDDDDSSWSSSGTDEAMSSRSDNVDEKAIVPHKSNTTFNGKLIHPNQNTAGLQTVSIDSLIQRTASKSRPRARNRCRKRRDGSRTGAEKTVNSDDSSTISSYKSTDAIGSTNNLRRSSLLQCLMDSGSIVIPSQAYLRHNAEKPLLLLPSSHPDDVDDDIDDDDITVQCGNTSRNSSSIRLRVTRITETVNEEIDSSAVLDTKKETTKENDDLRFDELKELFIQKMIKYSHAVESNVKQVAKQIKEKRRGGAPKTYFMSVTTNQQTVKQHTERNRSQHQNKHVATFICTTMSSSRSSLPIFALVDDLEEQPHALCIPSSYNKDLKKKLKQQKNMTVIAGLCHHIEDPLTVSYVIYGRKQFRHSNTVIPASTAAPIDNIDERELYRQQYYQRNAENPRPLDLLPSSATTESRGHYSLQSNANINDSDNECFYYEGYKYFPWMRITGTFDNSSSPNSPPISKELCRPTSAFLQIWNGKKFVDVTHGMTVSKRPNWRVTNPTATLKAFPNVVNPSTNVGAPNIVQNSPLNTNGVSGKSNTKKYQFKVTGRKSSKKVRKPMVLSRIEITDSIKEEKQYNLRSGGYRSSKASRLSKKSSSSPNKDKNDAENSFVMSSAERFHSTNTIQQTVDVIRNTSATSHLQNQEKLPKKIVTKVIDEEGWDLKINPDVDPALMLCLTVVLDEML